MPALMFAKVRAGAYERDEAGGLPLVWASVRQCHPKDTSPGLTSKNLAAICCVLGYPSDRASV